MNYSALKGQLRELRKKIVEDPKLSDQEREDLKLAVIVLLMYIAHREADRT